MQITIESILWVVGVLALASFIVLLLLTYGSSMMMVKDFTVYDVHLYHDGSQSRVFATVKNTGTAVISRIEVQCWEGSANRFTIGQNVYLEPGQTYQVNDWRNAYDPAVGRTYTLKWRVRFQDNSWKERMVRVVCERW